MDNPAEKQLIAAETKLARALQRLSALRRAALYGSYDATEFDQAVMHYRAAEAEVLDARKAWGDGKKTPPVVPISAEVADLADEVNSWLKDLETSQSSEDSQIQEGEEGKADYNWKENERMCRLKRAVQRSERSEWYPVDKKQDFYRWMVTQGKLNEG